RARPLRPRGLDAHADDHVHRPRRAARHVSLRRGGAGFGVAPQPERALQRGDGHRALTSPRADATVTNENNRRDAHMDHFTYRNFDLCCEQVSLRSVAADVGTPAYVYSTAALLERYGAYADAFAEGPHVVYSSLKAHANLRRLAPLSGAGD